MAHSPKTIQPFDPDFTEVALKAPMTEGQRAALVLRMEAAFDLVTPELHGNHWKSAIFATVPASTLDAKALTVTDVIESIMFYTGTQATMKVTQDGPLAYTFIAAGYWAGPCN